MGWATAHQGVGGSKFPGKKQFFTWIYEKYQMMWRRCAWPHKRFLKYKHYHMRQCDTSWWKQMWLWQSSFEITAPAYHQQQLTSHNFSKKYLTLVICLRVTWHMLNWKSTKWHVSLCTKDSEAYIPYHMWIVKKISFKICFRWSWWKYDKLQVEQQYRQKSSSARCWSETVWLWAQVARRQHVVPMGHSTARQGLPHRS